MAASKGRSAQDRWAGPRPVSRLGSNSIVGAAGMLVGRRRLEGRDYNVIAVRIVVGHLTRGAAASGARWMWTLACGYRTIADVRLRGDPRRSARGVSLRAVGDSRSAIGTPANAFCARGGPLKRFNLRPRRAPRRLTDVSPTGISPRSRPCLLARPEGFEPPTPRFVVCGC
jgi:hypothetical protein